MKKVCTIADLTALIFPGFQSHSTQYISIQPISISVLQRRLVDVWPDMRLLFKSLYFTDFQFDYRVILDFDPTATSSKSKLFGDI